MPLIYVVNNLSISAARIAPIKQYINRVANLVGGDSMLTYVLFTGDLFESRPDPFSLSISELNIFNYVMTTIKKKANLIICTDSVSEVDLNVLCNASKDIIIKSTGGVVMAPDNTPSFEIFIRPAYGSIRGTKPQHPTLCIINDRNPRIADNTVVDNSMATVDNYNMYLLCHGDRYARCKSPSNINIVAPGPFYSQSILDFGIMRITLSTSISYIYLSMEQRSDLAVTIDVVHNKTGGVQLVHNCIGLLCDPIAFDKVRKLTINSRGAPKRVYADTVAKAELAGITDITILGADVVSTAPTSVHVTEVVDHIKSIVESGVNSQLLTQVLKIHGGFTSIGAANKSGNADLMRGRFNLHKLSWCDFMSYSIMPNNISFMATAKDVVSLWGANGSGKTAVIDALLLTIYMHNAKDNIRSFINTSANAFTISSTMQYFIKNPKTGSDVYKTFVIERERTKHSGKDMLTCIPDVSQADGVADLYRVINAIGSNSTALPPNTIVVKSANTVANIVSDLCGHMSVALHTCISQQRYAKDLVGDTPNSRRGVYEQLFGITALNDVYRRVSTLASKLEQKYSEPEPCKELSSELERQKVDIETKCDELKQRFDEIKHDLQAIRHDINEIVTNRPTDKTSGGANVPQAPDIDRSYLDIAKRYGLTGATTNRVNDYIMGVLFKDAVEMESVTSKSKDQHVERLQKIIDKHTELSQAVEKQLAMKTRLETLLGAKRMIDGLRCSTQTCINSCTTYILSIYTVASAGDLGDQIRDLTKGIETLASNSHKIEILSTAITTTKRDIERIVSYGELMSLIGTLDELRRYNDATNEYTLERSRISPELQSQRSNMQQLIERQDKTISDMHSVTRQLTALQSELNVVSTNYKLRVEYEASIGKLSRDINIIREYKRCFEGPSSIQVRIIRERMPAICNEINNYLAYMGVNFRAALETCDSGLPSLMIVPSIGLATMISPQMASGFQYDVLNIALRVALWRQYNGTAPNFFIFDEPLAHADPTNARRLIEFFRYMMTWQDAPQFVLYTASDKSLAILADRTIVINRDDNGRSSISDSTLVASDVSPTETIMTKASYSYIVDTQDGCYCELCNVTLKFHTSIPKHINSKTHIKRVVEQKECKFTVN